MTGIICINKPKDITSFGVVAKCRGILREKKAGHTGTLDPMATGVLPVMLGGATKFLSYLPDSDKGYRATLRLGVTTDTLDITGNVIETKDVNVTEKEFLSALEPFRGVIMQVPPMFSAKSVDGKRLYDLARQGKEIEREPCRVEIKSLELTEHRGDEYVIDVMCSKGTYIRSLIDDIGRALGCGAVMTELVRTSAMGFSLDDCISLDDLQRLRDNGGDFTEYIHSVEKLFSHLGRVNVTEAQGVRFSNGGALDVKRIKTSICDNQMYAVYCSNKFLGLGYCKADELKAQRLLTRND